MSVMLIPITLFFSFFFFALYRSIAPAPDRVLNGDTLICFSRNKFFSRELLYCGTPGVFVYRGRTLIAHYRFEEVVRLAKTSWHINKVSVWEIECVSGGKHARHTFCPRGSLWFGHEGFDRLHEHMLRVNPNAVKTKWTGFPPHIDIIKF